MLTRNLEHSLYTRHYSIGPLSIQWNVDEIYSFYSFKNAETMLQGIIICIGILLIIYSLTILYFTHEISNLYFAGFIVSKVMFFFGFSGLIYPYNYDIALFFRENINMFASLALLFESLFIIHLYNLKEKSSFFYKLFSTSAIISTLMFIGTIYSAFTVFSIVFLKIIFIYITLITLIVFVFSIYAVYKKWTGARFFLIAVILYIYLRFLYLTFTNQTHLFNFVPMTVGIMEILFIQIAISLKIKELYDQKTKAQTALLEHAKYISIGKMHATTIHQLKKPIAQIGAIATRIRSVFEGHKNQLNEEEYESSVELEKIIKMAHDTISDLYDFYRADQQKEHFDLKESINEVIVLANTLDTDNTITIKRSLISSPIYNYPNSIKHILIVILENAIDILKEREIQNPQIDITLSQEDTNYKILICDNGKGVYIQPITDIFEMYKSYKKIKGLGVGLGLAKDLADFTGSYLSVTNSEKGACFKLIISIR